MNEIREKKIRKASSIVKKKIRKLKKEKGRNLSDVDIVNGQLLACRDLLLQFKIELKQ